MLIAGSASAQSLSSTPSGALTFSVSEDSAYIPLTVSYSVDTTTTVAFGIEWATTGVVNISVVQAQVTYDATRLTMDTAYATGNWTAAFDYSLMIGGDSTAYLLLELTAGSMAPPTDLTNLVEVVFSARCQPELTVNPIAFVENPAIGFVIADGNKFYPPAGNWDDGAVIIRDYYCNVYLPEETFTGAVGTKQWIDITASNNFNTYIAFLYLRWDADKLELGQVEYDTTIFQQFYGAFQGDSLLQIILIRYQNPAGPGAPEMDEHAFFSLEFELLCDMVNDTADLSCWV
jgi:hypothetical protein